MVEHQEAVIKAFKQLSEEDQIKVLKRLVKIQTVWPYPFCPGCAATPEGEAGHVYYNEPFKNYDVELSNGNCACSCHSNKNEEEDNIKNYDDNWGDKEEETETEEEQP